MRERTMLIAGNWKMNKGGPDGADLAQAVALAAKQAPGVDVVVAPPFTALAAVSQIAEENGNSIEVAGQNLYPADDGAFTGEVNAAMLLAAGCKWVIIGHSERRQLFGETDQDVRKKTIAALAAGLRPIVCIGETLEEREKHLTLDVVFRQLDAFADELSRAPGRAVIAYEPVWAIGTGKVAGPEQAQEVHAAVRNRLGRAPEGVADKTRILYGGSVKASNAKSLLSCVDVDGALVGGASLDPEGFTEIIQAARP
jgi:triosephosphate isomerase